jgi:hypothetical protein
MILSEAQQRWCAEHMLGRGFDDDNPDLVQYTHVCEFVGGDGDAPRPALAKNMTRKKLARVRRARNAWAREISVSTPSHRPKTIYAPDSETGVVEGFVIEKGPHDTAHYWRGRDNEEPQFETVLPSERPLCDGCYAWIGGQAHSTVFGGYYRALKYCHDCCDSGANDRDYERRMVGVRRRQQKLAYERQRSVAICRSPRLWCGEAGGTWRSAYWADITCADCLRILRERGCPEMP